MGDGGATAGVELDPQHSRKFVNLAVTGGQAGPAFDVYAVTQEISGLAPQVAGLAYASVSEYVSPGRRAGPSSGDYGQVLTEAGQTKEFILPTPNSDWTREIAVVVSIASGPSLVEFYLDPVTTQSLAAADASKATVFPGQYIGEYGSISPIDGVFMIGTSSGCWPSSAPQFAGDKADPINPNLPFLVPSGTAKIGFWLSKTSQPGPGDCTGTPLAEVEISGFAAGSRTMLFLYGTSIADVKVLAVPVP